MKTIDLAVSVTSLEELLQLATEDTVTVRTAEGREFILVGLDSFEYELGRIQQNPELVALLDQRSAEAKTYTLEQAKERLGVQ